MRAAVGHRARRRPGGLVGGDHDRWLPELAHRARVLRRRCRDAARVVSRWVQARALGRAPAPARASRRGRRAPRRAVRRVGPCGVREHGDVPRLRGVHGPLLGRQRARPCATARASSVPWSRSAPTSSAAPAPTRCSPRSPATRARASASCGWRSSSGELEWSGVYDDGQVLMPVEIASGDSPLAWESTETGQPLLVRSLADDPLLDVVLPGADNAFVGALCVDDEPLGVVAAESGR